LKDFKLNERKEVMPNQRKKGKRLVGFYEWETNVRKLQREADRRGITLSDLLKELSEILIEKTGGKYKAHITYDKNERSE
jgi:hypothetical protein